MISLIAIVWWKCVYVCVCVCVCGGGGGLPEVLFAPPPRWYLYVEDYTSVQDCSVLQ